ncbi:MAG: sugar phosphate isomerase/epimerase [Erysipelotrichaceae bacterium]|nr:sugar phosphate isomerase/epimerase [Erysipelotrichaceae bacterium]
MKQPAVVISNDNENDSVYDTIDAIAKAGFTDVFVQWYNKEWEVSQKQQLEYARLKGLHVIFAHLGYQNINDIWLDTETGEQQVQRYCEDIRICKEEGIDLVVMHLCGRTNPPVYNETGIRHLQKIVDYAESLDVRVAFENTKAKGYQEYVMEHIPNKNAGICFDAGHYHTHFKDEYDFSVFKNRIFAVHLHDNDQSGDQHKIPFDGTMDWAYVCEKLKENGYDGPVTSEQCYEKEYVTAMTLEEFYRKGYEACEKLAEM